MRTLFPFLKWVVLSVTGICVSGLLADEMPSSETDLTITGKLQLPATLPEGISTEGLEIRTAEITLRGPPPKVSTPFPKDYKKMSPEEKKKWYAAYRNSAEYERDRKRSKEAQKNRFRRTTTPDAEGKFSFTGLKPAWYEVRTEVYHERAEEKSAELSRASALSQFFLKKDPSNGDLGRITLRLKNVLLPGDPAPEITVSEDGGFTLSNHRGDYVLMDFWATWCAPCMREIPHLQEAHEKYAEKGLKVIGLNLDKEREAYDTFLKKKTASYRQIYIGAGEVKDQLLRAYGKTSIPAIWLIAPDGTLVARDLSGEEITETLRKVYSP